jgi:hypothetical protein
MRCVPLLVTAGLLAGSSAVCAAAPRTSPAPTAPSAQQVAALQAEAAKIGWDAVAQKAGSTAVASYEHADPQAQAGYYLFRWARLFGMTEAQAVARWQEDVRAAAVRYAPVEPGSGGGERALADLWPAELRTFALASPAFSAEFFNLFSPLDQPVMVMKILGAIWRQDPAEFKEYASLALAIAVVYDVPPPADWPHGQVGAAALSRRLPPPGDVFAFFVKADRAGLTLQRLRRLPASELKFLVDTSASFAELAWAQTKIPVPLAGLARTYGMVRYRRDRLEGGILVWPGPSYRLPDLLRDGGICVDQAYFAATTGKAKGVPTLLFRGAGMDGRHAWFGYLDGAGRWQLDGGRDATQKQVTGVAFDPQTWTNISDHELAFLAEGFRRLPLFEASRLNFQFAGMYYGAGNFAAAAKAARAAVNIEPRNLDAWNTLLVARQKLGGDPKQFEALLQEGARVFQRYPDIESEFKILLSRSLRARGQASQADFTERSAGHQYAAERGDLSARQAEEALFRSMAGNDVDQCLVTYRSVLKSFGPGAGIGFFDRIVRPFAEYLIQKGRPRDALMAVESARRTLRVEPESQLELNLNLLADRARQADR